MRWYGYEILDHEKGSINADFLKGGTAPFLLDHDTRRQIGVIQSVKFGSDKRGRAVVRFGKSALAEEAYQDVLDTIKANVSVGYQVHEIVLEKETENGPSTYRVTDWTPLEISLVAVPADKSVGVGRADTDGMDAFENLITGKTEVTPMPDDLNTKENGQPAGTPVVDQAVVAAEVKKQTEARMAEVEDIIALGTKHNMREEVNEALKNKTSLSAFRGIVLEKIGTSKPLDTPKTELGLEKKDVENYSLVRAARAAAEKDWSKAPLEREASHAVAEKLGKAPRGFFMPHDVFGKGFLAPNADVVRAVASGGTGGNLIATDYLEASFIELLRNKMKTAQLGVRVLDGLVGDVDIPKQTGGASTYWIDNETETVTASDPTFGIVSLTPKTIASKTVMTRKMLLQSAPSIEMLVRLDLLNSMALGMDLASLYGTGINNQPTGMFNTTGIGLVEGGTDGAAMDWADVVGLETLVADANADGDTMAYLTNARVRGALKTTEKAGGTNGQFIWSEGGELNGYRAEVSNQIAKDGAKGTGTDLSAMAFGNWSDILVGQWGVLDLKADDITNADSGGLILRAFQDSDVAVRYPQSFAVMTDIITG